MHRNAKIPSLRGHGSWSPLRKSPFPRVERGPTPCSPVSQLVKTADVQHLERAVAEIHPRREPLLLSSFSGVGRNVAMPRSLASQEASCAVPRAVASTAYREE
ncbi:hypothetical protein G7046_g9799 [Stylonectria norvegica]|nr:hypothetical protein G7046_g9799 [Stylonectria norvegica]